MTSGGMLREELQAVLGGAYRLERELGGGGMSRVFVAEETALGRHVVVKVLPPELATGISVERFRREIQLAAALQHPHVVPVLSAGSGAAEAHALPRLLHYTMPFVEGESLRARLAREGALPIADVVRVLRDVAGALDYAHRHGVVHRDIKPENVLLHERHALVTDFGIAKALAAATHDAIANVTSTGISIGTPAYMAPEQVAGDPAADARVDIYALGLLGYEMLAGRGPFTGASVQGIAAAQLVERPAPIATRRPQVPPALAALVMRCLEKDPDARPPSAGDVLAALEAVPTDASSKAALAPRAGGRLAVAGIALAALAALGAAWLGGGSDDAGRTAGAAQAAPIRSVVVLPFGNMSADPENEYFSDGVTEELIDALRRVEGLRVVSRTTAFAFKGQSDDVRTIGRRLGVDAVLGGSVRRAGDTVRITAELVRVGDGEPVWAETYERELRGIFAIQQDIARTVRDRVRGRLGGGVTTTASAAPFSPPSGDVGAYDLLLRGRAAFARGGEVGYREAAVLFEQAIARDSSFAAAHAGLVQTYIQLGEYEPPRELLRKAKEAALAAVRLDPSLPATHLALARVHLIYDRDWEAAERAFRRSLELDPGSATAHYDYGFFLLAERRSDEGIAAIRRSLAIARAEAVDSAAFAARMHARLAAAYGWGGDARRAVEHAREAVRLAPGSAQAHWTLGITLTIAGQLAEGIAELERVREMTNGALPFLTHLGYAYGIAGRRAEAREILAELERRDVSGYVPKDQFAALHVALGDRARAMDWLERAYDDYHYWMPYVNVTPYFASLRTEPRFQRLLERLGVPERARRP